MSVTIILEYDEIADFLSELASFNIDENPPFEGQFDNLPPEDEDGVTKAWRTAPVGEVKHDAELYENCSCRTPEGERQSRADYYADSGDNRWGKL